MTAILISRLRNSKLKIISNLKYTVPMKHFFTLETASPSEKTLNIIRQIAYSCRSIKVNGKCELVCLN